MKVLVIALVLAVPASASAADRGSAALCFRREGLVARPYRTNELDVAWRANAIEAWLVRTESAAQALLVFARKTATAAGKSPLLSERHGRWVWTWTNRPRADERTLVLRCFS